MINKSTIFVFIFLLFVCNIFAQNKNIDRLFSKYANKDGFSSLQIKEPSNTLPNMNKKSSKELKELLGGVDFIKVLKLEGVKSNPDIAKQFMDETVNFKPAEGFKEILSVKESTGFVKMHTKENASNVTDLLMIATEGKDVTVIWFNGKLDLEKITKSASLLPNILK